MRRKAVFILCMFPFFVAGCASESQNLPWDQLTLKSEETTQLKLQVKQLESENADLRGQVATLAALDSEIRAELLSGLRKIEIGRRSGLYDKDGDGRKELLVVYIRPYDTQLDVVKIAGSANAELWDLGLEPAEALLGKWQVGPDELKELWSATMMTNYYRLTFDVGNILGPEERELTVRVRFTDYITGKALQEQHVIAP
ncbi:MAG: hypothetical protein KAR47_11495 [Planctomycetes bacterium]|nr:hypothetical protein [Planctomycetota bacterium]